MSMPGYWELLWRLTRVRWRLRLHGFAQCAQSSLSAPADQPWIAGLAVAQRLRRLARWLPGSTCLHRSLALIDAARARGLSARLVIGAQRAAGVSRTHAWVLMGDQTLGERQLEGVEYQPFPAPEAKP